MLIEVVPIVGIMAGVEFDFENKLFVVDLFLFRFIVHYGPESFDE